jgi:hypothetical protein
MSPVSNFTMSGNNGHQSSSNGSRQKPRTTATLKQERFCRAYIQNSGNGVQAAREAGYKGNARTLESVASENLRKPIIKSFLAQLTAEADRARDQRLMGSQEALWLTSLLARTSLDDILDDAGRFDLAKARRTGAIFGIKKLTFYQSGQIKAVELRDKNASVELMGKHHGLWTDEFEDPREVLARILGRPKGWLPPKLDEPDAIEAEAVEVPNKSEERSLTLAGKSTELPADVALNTNREHDLEKRTEPELPQYHEPTPQESIISNPPTPSTVELDEKAPVKNIPQGYRKLNGAKSVTWKDNSVEAAQNYAPVSGSRTLL